MKRILAVGVAGFEPATSCSQSRRDDRATLHPGLSVIKMFCKHFYSKGQLVSWTLLLVIRISGFTINTCGETGTRTLATLTRRQISNLLHYHSGTSPIFLLNVAYFAVANVTFSFYLMKLF